MASSLEQQWTQQLEAQKELVLRDLQKEVLEYHKRELTREVSAATLVMRIDEMNARIKQVELDKEKSPALEEAKRTVTEQEKKIGQYREQIKTIKSKVLKSAEIGKQMKEKLEKYKNLYNLIQTSLKDANEGIQKIQV